MPRYPVKQPPAGYAVHFDRKNHRYYPALVTPDGLKFFDGPLSYAKRADAVQFCEIHAEAHHGE